MSTADPSNLETAPADTGGRGSFLPVCREFWRGLTTPSFGVVLGALGCLLAGGTVIELLARKSWLVEQGPVTLIDSLGDHFARESVMALQGARRLAPGPEETLLLVGPSALRLWSPGEREAARIAREQTGQPVRVLTMCSNAQSYALTAALIERFGSDFEGWIVIAVNRQMIARRLTPAEEWLRQTHSLRLGFESTVLREESDFLGLSQNAPTGLALYDRREFNHLMKLGWFPAFPGKTGAYRPHDLRQRPYELEKAADAIGPYSKTAMDLHLAVLERLVNRVRATGRARVALVETPWVDTYDVRLQTAEWKTSEAAYVKKMNEWTQLHSVPWLTGAARFKMGPQDFLDPRHVNSDKARREFAVMLARELITAAAP